MLLRSIRHFLIFISYFFAVGAVGTEKETFCTHAAIFTPHDVINSEDTRYLMGIISALQMVWCTRIDVLVTESNACKTDDCFHKNDMDTVVRFKGDYSPHIRVISVEGSVLKPLNNPGGVLTNDYDVFVLFGNEKLPQFAGIGTGVNFYVCNFPYDMDEMQSEDRVTFLTTYDGIMTPSYFSMSKYVEYIRPYFLRARKRGLMLPDIHVNLQPVVPLVPQKVVQQFKALNNTIYISFYGDFYPGESRGGHDVALTLLSRLAKDLPYVHLKLYMLGRRVNVDGTDEYINSLRAAAASSKLDVDFLVDPSWNDKSKAIGTSQILWDMDGYHQGGSNDPRVGAVIDTAVVQAMAAGAVVIAQRHGVASEIIKNNRHGFLAETLNDYYEHSVAILHSDLTNWAEIKSNAALRAASFSPLKVISKTSIQIKSSVMLEVFHKFVAKYSAVTKAKQLTAAAAGSTTKIAVILLTGFETTSEFVIRHTLRKLGAEWQLAVWLSPINDAYFREVLQDISNVQFNYIPKHLIGDELAESVFLKSASFWDSLQAEKAFIFGPRTLIANPNINTFMEYDFIGSPYVDPQFPRQTTLGISGSCSLRTISSMKAMLTKYQEWGNTATVSEEFFFWTTANKPDSKLKLPSAQIMNDFAVGAGFPELKDYHTPVCLDNPWEHIGKKYKEENILRWMDQAVEDLDNNEI